MAMMKPAVIPEFFARLKKAMPEPETELEYDNVYQLLVAVVLSAQATDKSVNKATEKLYAPWLDGIATLSALRACRGERARASSS